MFHPTRDERDRQRERQREERSSCADERHMNKGGQKSIGKAKKALHYRSGIFPWIWDLEMDGTNQPRFQVFRNEALKLKIRN